MKMLEGSPSLRRRLPVAIYAFALCDSLMLLYYGASERCFGVPVEGTDQLSMLQAAAGLCHGHLPLEGYMYSPSYTLMLAAMGLLSGGSLLAMRALQGALCALIPALIYKLGLRMRLGMEASLCGAILYCLYGPAQLMALDFLRAAPLGLCFIVWAYLLTCGWQRSNAWLYAWAGAAAGLCILGRENYMPVAFAPAALLLLKDVRRHVNRRRIIAYAAGTLLVTLPVVALNFARFGKPSIIPGHVANVMGAYHGSAEASKLDIALKVPEQAFKFVSSYEIPNSLSFYAHREVIDYLNALFVPFNALVALCAVALMLNWRNRGVLLGALLVAAYAGSMLFFEMFYRFRIPAAPLMALMAGSGIAMLVKGGGVKMKVAALAAACAIFALTWRNPDSLRPPHERISVVKLLISNGRFAKAESLIGRMDADGIDTWALKLRLKAAEFEEASGGR